MNKRKKLTCLFALLLMGQVMYSQNVDSLFRDFAKEKGVVHVGIGKFTMSLASLFTDVMGVSGIEVYSFEECDQSIKEKLNTAIASLRDSKYETMVSVNENTERTKILVKTEGEFIQELVVMTSGNDPALIRIKGKIKPSDVENVINKNK